MQSNMSIEHLHERFVLSFSCIYFIGVHGGLTALALRSGNSLIFEILDNPDAVLSENTCGVRRINGIGPDGCDLTQRALELLAYPGGNKNTTFVPTVVNLNKIEIL